MPDTETFTLNGLVVHMHRTPEGGFDVTGYSLAEKTPPLVELIAGVRAADAAYTEARLDDNDEAGAWERKQVARRALNDAVIAQLGVNAHELQRLVKT